jgi:hypothetical protein
MPAELSIGRPVTDTRMHQAYRVEANQAVSIMCRANPLAEYLIPGIRIAARIPDACFVRWSKDAYPLSDQPLPALMSGIPTNSNVAE